MTSRNPNESGSEEMIVSSEEPSFGDILSEYEKEHTRKAEPSEETSATLDGTVISVTAESVFVDLGRKQEGVLPADAVRDAAGNVNLKPGQPIKVSIAGRDDNGYYRLSVFKVIVPKDWSGLETAFADKAIISGTVEEVVKGGLRVDVGARAFLPASRSGARDQADLEKLVGQTIECRITKLDTTKEDVVVDRRGILEERAAKAKEEAFNALQEGTVLEGTVRTVMEFGAFVDLGGVDGLVHVTEMSWVRGAKPSEIVKSGDRVQVKILKVDAAKRKVALGMKQLQADPWTVALASIEPGQRLKGKVARLTDFGAFVELQPGVEGMIHVSEMSWSKKQKRPQDILKVGELVEVQVLGVKPEDRRIALSLKQTLGDPWEEAKKRYAPGSTAEGPVTSLANFGAFIDLGDDIEGMIHIGDITHERRLQHPKELLTVGQMVKAAVIELDDERRRIRLSMKQLEPTSADEYIAEHKVGDVVTGRVLDVHGTSGKIELAEGVKGTCKIVVKEEEKKPEAAKPAAASSADLGSLTAMLSAKWKAGSVQGGASSGSAAASADPNALRMGQVRQFRITALTPEKKHIDLEVA